MRSSHRAHGRTSHLRYDQTISDILGFEVTWVVNITDVDDKLIASSKKRGISMFQVATQMTADYLANLQSLGVDQIDHMPRATENMDEIIKFVQETNRSRICIR